MTGKKLIMLFFTVLVFVFLSYYLFSNRETFSYLGRLDLFEIFLVVGLIILFQLSNALFLIEIVRPFGVKLQRPVLLTFASSFLNLVTPFRGGAGFRAVYLKKKYNLNYTDFLSSLFGNYIVIFLSSSFLALTCFLFFKLQYDYFDPLLFTFFLLLFLGSIFVVVFRYRFKSKAALFVKINQVVDGWEKITRERSLVLRLFLITLMGIFFNVLINKTVFFALGFTLDWPQVLFLAVIGVVSLFVNLTPGSLGVTEGLYFISAELLAVPPNVALVAALVIRALSTIVLVGLGSWANIILLKDLRKVSE